MAKAPNIPSRSLAEEVEKAQEEQKKEPEVLGTTGEEEEKNGLWEEAQSKKAVLC